MCDRAHVAHLTNHIEGYDTQGEYVLKLRKVSFSHLPSTAAEITQIAAANIGWDILALMAKTPLVE